MCEAFIVSLGKHRIQFVTGASFKFHNTQYIFRISYIFPTLIKGDELFTTNIIEEDYGLPSRHAARFGASQSSRRKIFPRSSD
jgi:hypothetical protein